jgi:hypothetical protein
VFSQLNIKEHRPARKSENACGTVFLFEVDFGIQMCGVLSEPELHVTRAVRAILIENEPRIHDISTIPS